MDNKFTAVGMSRCDKGIMAFRFSNNAKQRTNGLKESNHSDIYFIDLPYAMTKDEALEILSRTVFANYYTSLTAFVNIEWNRSLDELTTLISNPIIPDTTEESLNTTNIILQNLMEILDNE